MVERYEKNENVRLSENFRLGEFKCKCERCDTVLVDTELVGILQKLRDHFGVSIDINSGYRCEKHNAEVGGASGSHHMKGMAADIRVAGVEPKEVAKYAESIGVERIGLYDSFVHIGSGETKRFWLGHEGTVVDTLGGAPVKVCTVSVPVLKRGMKNDTVRTLQRLLPGVEVDGSFGPATEQAVRAFQRKTGLQEDGIVGPASWAKLLGA